MTRSTIGLLIALAVGGCASEETIVPRDVVRPVRMMTVGSDSAARSYEYPGRVDATLNALLSFNVSGLITEMLVDEGQQVSEGQILARLDPSDYEAQRDAAAAQRNQARADYQRYQQLYSADAASMQELDVARRAYEVSESQLRIAQKAVDDTQLRALFQGTVSRRLVEEFENVQAKQPVLTVQDENQLEVKFDIPESDAALWIHGATPRETDERYELDVGLTSSPERRFPATIKEMATTANPTTRTFEITLSFTPDPNITARTGMTAIVRAAAAVDDDVLRIPASAVVGDAQGGSFVWRIDASSMRVSRAPVELGDMAGDRVIVLSGLAAGDTIATAGAQSLADGMQVRPLSQ